MQIKHFPESTTPSNADKLIIQDANDITKHITRGNFLTGIGGGGSLSTPSDIKELTFWLEADKSTGTPIDSSDFDCSITSSSSPTRISNGINNLPSYSFNSNSLIIKYPIPTQTWTALIICKPTAFQAYTAILGYGTATDYGGYFIKSNGKSAEYSIFYATNSYDGTGAATFSINQSIILEVTHTSSAIQTFKNKILDGRALLGFIGIPELIIGNHIVGGRGFIGQISAVLIFSKALKKAERDFLYNLYSTKYGISI